MMKHNTMRKLLSFVGCFVLIAAMALNFTGCTDSKTIESAETTATTENVPADTTATTEETGTVFILTVTDLNGKDIDFVITTDKETVGEALLDEGLISGTDSEYGLMVDTVNGVTADWNADQTYWAFYIDGEYAMTGVDQTPITAGTSYSFVLTKG